MPTRALESQIDSAGIRAIQCVANRTLDKACRLRDGKSVIPSDLLDAVVRNMFNELFRRISDREGVVAAENLIPDSKKQFDVDRGAIVECVDVLLASVNTTEQIGLLHERLLGVEVEIDLNAVVGKRVRFMSRRASRRRGQGSFYTPAALVEHLLDASIDPALNANTDPLSLRVCDPACGSGNFLVAASRRLARAHAMAAGCSHTDSIRQIISTCVFGVDADALAVDLCRATLALEARDASLMPTLRERIVRGDALIGAPSECRNRDEAEQWMRKRSLPLKTRPSAAPPVHWPIQFPNVFSENRGGFDVVVGNPPFLNQLSSQTAAPRTAAAILKERSNGAVFRYADSASAFLWLACEIIRPGGRVALVQPASVLSVSDASGVRTSVLETCELESLWLSNERMFDASVDTAAVVLRKTGPRCDGQSCLRRWRGADFAKVSDLHINLADLIERETWAHLVADIRGIPHVDWVAGRFIREVAHVTADFRDQYYGLAGFLVEHDRVEAKRRDDWAAFPLVLTSGLIDLAHHRWGLQPTRILKNSWNAPRIDRERMRLEGTLGDWLDDRLVPKILLATQTRVIEVVVDERGAFVPAVPVITIVPHDVKDIWRIAAILASPVSVALAMERYGGAALSSDAIKLAARQVASLPMPAPSAELDAAAEAFRHASAASASQEKRGSWLHEAACHSVAAFGVPVTQREELHSWWSNRLRRQSRRPIPAAPRA